MSLSSVFDENFQVAEMLLKEDPRLRKRQMRTSWKKSESDLSLKIRKLKNQDEEKLNYGEEVEMTSLETDEQNEIKKEKIHEPQKRIAMKRYQRKKSRNFFLRYI
ncbi:hypothetical protein CEXT_207581 [Caerostris extrusa]|uniref:Uncharacterized protein n=1 Tax=Caerostris extrusa TaxID=172846 RepID=A0AAV4YCZ7_CAEEX|nr:hypothetical protein CEXT_207581 [Caerostris extrusa]